MTDLKDVIWRIREKFPVDHAELLDLADRIEALEAENERLREKVEYLAQDLQKYRAKYMVGTSAALGEKQ